MKTRTKHLLVTGLSLSLALNVHGAVPVIDPALIEQQALAHAEELAQFVNMVENQVRQITVLTDQLGVQNIITRILGDPSTNTSLAGLEQVLANLEELGINLARQEFAARLSVPETQRYDGGGLYQPVGESFRTLDGKEIPRLEAEYKPGAALVKAVANYDAVHRDVQARREVLRQAMGKTLEQLQQATTAAETQKLLGVLTAQQAELVATNRDLFFAAQEANLQDIDNRNDRERQAKARSEEQGAEFDQAFRDWQKFVRPNTAPTPLRSPLR